MDQELADAAAYTPGGRRVCTRQTAALSAWNDSMATILKVWCHIKNRDSVNRCVFTWRTILLNLIPIRFETTEPYVHYVCALRCVARDRNTFVLSISLATKRHVMSSYNENKPLGFLKVIAPTRKTTTTRSGAIWDQFLIQKYKNIQTKTYQEYYSSIRSRYHTSLIWLR